MPLNLYKVLLLVFSLSAMPCSANDWLSQDLQRFLPEWEQQVLTQGQQSLLVAHRQAMTPYQQGTLLLIPDPTQHPASPRHINFLRQHMNQHGWKTLAILSNHWQQQSSEMAKQQLEQDLMLVLTEPEWQSGHLVVLAQGRSGSLVSQLDWSRQPRQPDAMVLLSSYESEPTQNRALAKRIAQLSMPVLDLAHHQDHQHIAATFELRQQWSRQQANLLYRQRMLTGKPELETTQQLLYKELYGWLTYLGL
ncbi:DUF3530 family protein [Alkalimonas delamerensis]|uniref:DUF3530 family protein n=1 Tax=Alkalimonas delamerensis TaxID=265981 RepID=A0ABT9GKZ5_9GAMM|nr:DUF3530 family protein [Alkalimonas delamerensis]MDP4527643.1 DUF3530 family protein [Alkalimonas delamerensis]